MINSLEFFLFTVVFLRPFFLRSEERRVGKELLMHKYKKHLRLGLNSMINSLEFFLFYGCISSTFRSFLFFLLSSPPLNPFSSYIRWFLHHFLHPRVSQMWEFVCPISHLLEPSTISCKAACLLFRHHLQINAVRELVGKHLMWG